MPKVYVDKPKAIVFDFVGSAVKIGFIEKGLYAYIKKYGVKYLEERWNTKECRQLIANLKHQVEKDKEKDQNIPALEADSAALKTQVNAVISNLNWYLDKGRETNAHYKLKFAMWKDAYENQRLETHIYSDAARNIKKWRKAGIKTYIFSNAWHELQKLFLRFTTFGNLARNIDGYFDTEIGNPTDPETYKKIMEMIKVKKGSDMLFITKSPQEAFAARSAGIIAILIISHATQQKQIEPSVLEAFQVIKTFDQLKFTDEEEEAEEPEREEDYN
ncbi:enolase-phosphatase E-1-like protein 3 [Dinothrombium tinctorium]|uniref:Enolase-phosphatase E-1-like protein 3 n=1 Tax=Dinothrombium tinctorium TaxID=1965070 RepID=A0A443R6C1_9ACAR|nr:enolase-phosphatase E-1-like protein 3 [Dinothrombium tinctorium]